MAKKKIKALALLSGGLDSILAAKLLMEQDVEVTGLIFKSYFFNEKNGIKATKQLGIPYRVFDFSKKHLEIVKKPLHGYGKAANPCLDCHLLMLKIANQILKDSSKPKGIGTTSPLGCNRFTLNGFDYNFVATGEVLGERPFSQSKQALAIIAKESGLNDQLLRPLSAKLLPISLPEKKGWVDREKLLAIQGRRRQPQMELAKKYGLAYPSPSGGCILCEKEFAKKLFALLEKRPDCGGDDIALLSLGRHFWHGRTKIVLGKNQEENEKLEKLAKKSDTLIKPTNFPGSTALIRSREITPRTIKKTKRLIISYSKKISKKPEFSLQT